MIIIIIVTNINIIVAEAYLQMIDEMVTSPEHTKHAHSVLQKPQGNLDYE